MTMVPIHRALDLTMRFLHDHHRDLRKNEHQLNLLQQEKSVEPQATPTVLRTNAIQVDCFDWWSNLHRFFITTRLLSGSRPYNAYEELKRDYIPNRGVSFSNNTQYQTVNTDEIPSRSYQNSIYPSSTRSNQSSTYANPPRESRRLILPNSFDQSTNSSVTRTFDEDRFRKDPPSIDRNTIDPSLSHQVEIREYSRRLDANGQNTSDLPLFPRNFNSDAFYRSSFQPKVITDDHGQKMIEMKLGVSEYQPSEIKISVNGLNLVVQAEHNEERPPSASSRAYFFNQISLPSNTDLASLSSQYHPDGKLHITAKILADRNLM